MLKHSQQLPTQLTLMQCMQLHETEASCNHGEFILKVYWPYDVFLLKTKSMEWLVSSVDITDKLAIQHIMALNLSQW